MDLVPKLRTDFVRRNFGTESLVWSPLAAFPTALDSLATVMLDVVDGTASIGELAVDVHEVVGVPLEDAQRQVIRIVELFDGAGVLTSSSLPSTSTAVESIESRDLFLASPTPCAENASRLGTTTLHLRFGRHTIRASCDSRRGARKLRQALAHHEVEATDDAPLGFVLTAPQGLQRHHRLEDRSGFVLSEARGLDSGLHALACHLTALLPPEPGCVRIQARTIAFNGDTIVCLSPLLYFPAVGEQALAKSGIQIIDRLALDVEIATGRITNPNVPWPELATLERAASHLGTGGTRTANAIVTLAGAGSAPPGQAQVVAQLASSALDGSIEDVLDAATRLVEGAELRTAPPEEGPFIDVISEL